MLQTTVPKIFTEEDAQRILQDYPAHPGTNGRVRYMPHNVELVVSAVRNAWIDAAIVPPSDELRVALKNPANMQRPEEIQKYSNTSITRMTAIPPEISTHLNEFQNSRIQACVAFMHAAEYSDDEMDIYILTYQPGCYRSFSPMLHVDRTFNVYTATHGAPMQFLALNIGRDLRLRALFGCKDFEEQRPFLNEELNDRFDEKIDINDHIVSIEPGAIVVFNGAFFHKSSEFVQRDGQIAYSLNPCKAVRDQERKAYPALPFVDPP